MRGTALPLLAGLLSTVLLQTQALPRSSLQTPFSASFGSSGLASHGRGIERYDGQQVWRLIWSGMNQASRRDIELAAELLHLDIWRSSPLALDIRLNPSELSQLRAFLPPSLTTSSTSDALSLFIPDLQALVDASSSAGPLSTRALSEEENMNRSDNQTQWDVSSLDCEFHKSYHSLEEISSFGDALISKFGQMGVEVETIIVGKTFEGREIKGWRARIPQDEEGDEFVAPGDSVEWEDEEDEAVLRLGDERSGKDKKGKHGKHDKGKKGKHGKKGKRGKHGHGGGGGRASYKGIRELIVQSGQHAREWVGPASALYFLHSILLDATSDPHGEIAKIMRSFTFTIVPTVNPDGYTYSREHSRLWRKNRQDVGGADQGCYGIDMNTNWGYKWRPSRATVCSDTFSGNEEFEAFETRAMANYLQNGTTWLPEDPDPELESLPRSGGEKFLMVGGEPTPAPSPGKRRVRAFVDLHSYGQLFMFPFAYSCDDFPPDAEMLMEAALGVAKSMKKNGGQGYQAGQACDLTYRAPGDAIDYSYGVSDVRWSYSAELRDTGTYGFMLPPHLIRPTAEDVTAGLTYLAKFIYNAEVAG